MLATALALGASTFASGAEAPSEGHPPASHYECPAANPVSAEPRNPFDARELKELKMRRARHLAAKHGCSIRVVRRNGNNLDITSDYISNRINVNVRDGRVKRIRGIG